MYPLKPLHVEAIPRALERAERYRLLNEPWEAESICRDVLSADPDHHDALVSLLLSLTDQFGQFGARGVVATKARELLPRIKDEYQRAYYEGVIDERWAKAGLHGHHLPGHATYDWIVAAMRCYEKAEKLSPRGNEDAILRWNACVRLLEMHPELKPEPDDGLDAGFSDDAPRR